MAKCSAVLPATTEKNWMKRDLAITRRCVSISYRTTTGQFHNTPQSTYRVCLSWTNLPSSSSWRTPGRRLRTRTRAVGRTTIAAVHPPSRGPIVDYLRATWCFMSAIYFHSPFTRRFSCVPSRIVYTGNDRINVFRTFGTADNGATKLYRRRRNVPR